MGGSNPIRDAKTDLEELGVARSTLARSCCALETGHMVHKPVFVHSRQSLIDWRSCKLSMCHVCETLVSTTLSNSL